MPQSAEDQQTKEFDAALAVIEMRIVEREKAMGGAAKAKANRAHHLTLKKLLGARSKYKSVNSGKVRVVIKLLEILIKATIMAIIAGLT